MGVGKHAIATKHIAFSKWLRGAFLQRGTQGGAGIGDDVPRLQQAIGWGERPRWAGELVPPGEIFGCARAKGCPVALLFCRVLWHLNGIVEQRLAFRYSIHKKG